MSGTLLTLRKRSATGWALAAIVGSLLLGGINYARLLSEFEAEGRNLHRIVSQRADQHDALLTGMGATLAAVDPSLQGARAVADAVRRLYPRVTAVDVLALEGPSLVFTTRETGLAPDVVARLAAPGRDLQPGTAALLFPGVTGNYVMVKRVPGIGGVGAGVATLDIDAGRLVQPETPLHSWTTVVVAEPGGRPIYTQAPPADVSVALPAFTFERPLGSRSQPVVLRLTRYPTLGEVLPPFGLLGVALGAAGLVSLVLYVLSARRTTARAERQALMLQHETRLAHAMRINAVGEMGSGIAHELTQPLAAILAQAQAGLRLAHSNNASANIMSVLDAIVRHAKRGGDILGRLRTYVDGGVPKPHPTDVKASVMGVAELVAHDLEARGVALTIDLDPSTRAIALLDPVSLEQIIHNLIRNAADAVLSAPECRREIKVSVRTTDKLALIAVTDSGPGIPPDDLPRLFEPFFTTKPGGMGLGLPLCERLAEAFGGRIEAKNLGAGGAELVLHVPLVHTLEERVLEREA